MATIQLLASGVHSGTISSPNAAQPVAVTRAVVTVVAPGWVDSAQHIDVRPEFSDNGGATWAPVSPFRAEGNTRDHAGNPTNPSTVYDLDPAFGGTRLWRATCTMSAPITFALNLDVT